MKKFLGLAAVALALIAGSTAILTVNPQAAFACSTWHCGCDERAPAVGCRG
jgi:hypothetical protein